jgi:DNA transformation protein
VSRLDEIPNLGPVLAEHLRAVGITTRDRLQEVGAEAAWEQVGQIDPDWRCAHALLALVGATKGVRWMALPEEERRHLRRFAHERGGRA